MSGSKREEGRRDQAPYQQHECPVPNKVMQTLSEGTQEASFSPDKIRFPAWLTSTLSARVYRPFQHTSILSTRVYWPFQHTSIFSTRAYWPFEHSSTLSTRVN